MKSTTIVLGGALLGCLFLQPAVEASGSISAGKGISPRDAYTPGKALTFQKLVCDSCPLQQGDLDRDRAMSLKNSLEARDEADKPGTEDDSNIGVLCPGSDAGSCADRPDEQELVHYYLTRRYKL